MKVLIIAAIVLYLIYRLLGRRTIVNIIRRSLGFGPIGSNRSNLQQSAPKRRKVFGKNDGEYVDFEEIKSDKEHK